MVAGAITGWVWPGATVLEPLGTIFINMMFCVVVPLVFFSISSAVANMVSARKAGKVMGTTVVTFLCTAAIAAIIMYVIVRVIGVVPAGFEALEPAEAEAVDVTKLIINFFTKPDFTELFSRRAILPLIVAAILFGFGVQMAGGKGTMTAKLLSDINTCLMKTMRLITYYAPIGFFGFFAYLVATFGPEFLKGYGRTLVIYYVVAFAYMFIFAPIYARFGGGKGAEKVMWQHIFAPAAVSFGTCSSVATIPTNMEACEDTGVSKDVSEIVIPLGATMHMRSSSPCSPRSPCPASPAAAARARWCSAPSSSPSSSRWRCPSPGPSAISSIPPPPWSTPRWTTSPPTSSPSTSTARIGSRRGWPPQRSKANIRKPRCESSAAVL